MDTKALRQKILDLAIRGKLVPQDPNDEPASVLLERIRAEKQQMVKDGKLKPKDIKNDTIIFVGEDNLHYEKFQDGTVKCIEDEIPFEVPEGWEWCRLTEITFEIFAGGDKPENYSKTQTDKFSIPIFANGAENDGLYGFTNKARVNKSAITVSARGTIGFCCIRHMPFVPIVRLITIVPAEGINIEYLRIVFQSLIETGEGSSIPQLTVPGIKPKLIPIPPYSEQTKISNKLIETEKIVSAVELNQESVVNYIKLAKSKILDLAIRGQLVPQDPNDEPASVLLERIRAEKEELIKTGKIKRDKKESIIFKGDDNSYYEKIGNKSDNIDENIPFEIPVTWNWCRGYTCFAGMESKKPTDKFFDYIDIDSIDNHNHKIKKPKHLPASDAPSRASRAVQTGSVLFSLVRPYLENIALVEEKNANSIASTGFYVCNSAGVLYSEYMFFLMISGYVVSGLNQFMKGDNSPSISKDNIESWLYPIPPYEEQKVICKKIKSIFSKIEAIEKSLS